MSRPGSFQFIESDNQKEAQLNEEAILQIRVLVAMTKIETAIFNSKITFANFSNDTEEAENSECSLHLTQKNWKIKEFRKVSLGGKKEQ